jgi:competence transcription factor ComK
MKEKNFKKFYSQEPFTLEKQLNDEIWISFHRLELQKEIDKIDADLQLSQERYKSIVGEKYSSVQEQNKETILFEQKFSDTTYFGQR